MFTVSPVSFYGRSAVSTTGSGLCATTRQSRDVPLNTLIYEKTAATQLSLSLRTLRHWHRQGRGPQYVKLGSAIRYRPQDIERWVEERAQLETRR